MAIIVLQGEVETLGERVAPYGVIFYPAGEPHGIRNPGERTAKYLMFEFHGGRPAVQETVPAVQEAAPAASLSWGVKLRDPGRWKAWFRNLLGHKR